MTRKTWFITIGIVCALIVILMQGPQVVHQLRPESQGLLVHLNSDEHYYQARVQEVLSGRSEQAEEAFVGDPEIEGTQFALLERFYGSVFRFFGLNAATVFQILDGIVPVLIFLTLISFFQLCGFSRVQSLLGASLFVLLELYNLNRPIHMRSSFLVMLLALTFLTAGLRYRKWMGIVGGALLGLLVGIYFWSFSFAWLWFGIFIVWEFLEALRTHQNRRWKILLIFGVVGLIVASPFVLRTIGVMQHPLAEYGVFRSGIHNSRMPESWGYTAVFTLMILGLSMTMVRRYRDVAAYKPAAVTLFTAFFFMHQQVFHGKILMFVSHSIFSLMLGAISVLLLAWVLRTRWMFIAALGACVYLAAIGYDGRYIFNQWSPRPGKFEGQHFSTLLPILDELPRTQILSDPTSSAFIAGSTHHDIVYSIYLKNVLMTHEEIAQRFCMTQISVDLSQRNYEERRHLIWPDSNLVFKKTIPDIREQELALVREACGRVDQDPRSFLQKFGMIYVLWDEKRHPEWDLGRLRVPLEKIVQDEGWSLWGISI